MEDVSLNFDPNSLNLLQWILGFIMFGIALELKFEHFKMLLLKPKPVLVGVFSQFFALPALTYGFVLVMKPDPSVALGLMLVAACPGGNISNFISLIARGNTELSVSLTAIATVAAIFMTPFNFMFYANLYGPTQALLTEVSIPTENMFMTIALLLGLPLVLGMLIGHRFPGIVAKVKKYVRALSLMVFVAFVVVAFINNMEAFRLYVHKVILLVFLHNAIAMTMGYHLGSLFKLNTATRRALSIETGIQNSGLGLVIIFTYFELSGGMAIATAWWAIWHMVAGFTVAFIWSKPERVRPIVAPIYGFFNRNS